MGYAAPANHQRGALLGSGSADYSGLAVMLYATPVLPAPVSEFDPGRGAEGGTRLWLIESSPDLGRDLLFELYPVVLMGEVIALRGNRRGREIRRMGCRGSGTAQSREARGARREARGARCINKLVRLL